MKLYMVARGARCRKVRKCGLQKIIEFRIMADHYDQKCHVLILIKNKIIKKGGFYTTRIDNHLSFLENGFSTHVSTHLSRRRPVVMQAAAFDRVCVIKFFVWVC